MNRRSSLKFGIACILCGRANLSAYSGEVVHIGCALISGGNRTSTGIGVFPGELNQGSGDPQLDRKLGKALARLSSTFAVRPNFSFYDDKDGENALATDVEGDTPGTHGLVLMGRGLFSQLLQRFGDNGMAVLLVLAHEFGHIAQFQRKAYGTLVGADGKSKLAELHADLLAGYYLGRRKAELPNLSLREAGLSLFQIGDFQFNAIDHHGTPKERVASAEKGFAMARSRNFNDVFDEGRDWILQSFQA
ncbi:MAG: hypothetical protein EKK47_23520 [Burkholderiales bacterium]|nr:MAG: hypothetical protein EKK47_23520 [Burkholderiales bacterium]